MDWSDIGVFGVGVGNRTRLGYSRFKKGWRSREPRLAFSPPHIKIG